MLYCTKRKLSANPYHVLGLPSKKGNGSHYSLQQIRTAFYARAKEVHPDAGGSAQQFRELRQAYDTVKSQCKQNYINHNNSHYNNNYSSISSMYANKGFYNHPHAQWSRAQYGKQYQQQQEYQYNNYYGSSHYYQNKSETEWMRSYAQKCKDGNERFYAKQREAQQQRMQKQWQDYKTIWNDLNSQDLKSKSWRRRKSSDGNKRYYECGSEQYERWFRSAPLYANYSSWYFYRPYSTHVNQQFDRNQCTDEQNNVNSQSSSSRVFHNIQRQWAKAQRQRSRYYNERQERRWVQLLVKTVVLCMGVATVYYSYNKQSSLATLQKEQQQKRQQYMYNYYQLRNAHRQEVEHKPLRTSKTVNDPSTESQRTRRLERYRSSPQTVPHVIRYQGRPFTADGVRGSKNVAVKTPATFIADKTCELYDDDDDDYKHATVQKSKHEDKSESSTEEENNNKETIAKVAN